MYDGAIFFLESKILEHIMHKPITASKIPTSAIAPFSKATCTGSMKLKIAKVCHINTKDNSKLDIFIFYPHSLLLLILLDLCDKTYL